MTSNAKTTAIGAALALAFATNVWAQDTATTPPRDAATTDATQVQAQAGRDRLMRDMRTSELIGMNVRNAQGQDLGEIQDVVLDVNNDRVHYAILSFGGFAGLGDKLFAYPVRMFGLGPDERSLTLNVSKEQLENAPGFETRRWPRWNVREDTYRADVERYFGGDTVKIEPAPNALLRRASQVIDADVHNGAGKEIGEVEDVVVNMHDGSVRYLAVDFDDEYADENDRIATLPMQAFRMPKDDDGDLQIRLDRQAMRDVPRFEKDRWPDMNTGEYSSRVERWFADFGDRSDRAVGDAPAGQQRDRSQQ